MFSFLCILVLVSTSCGISRYKETSKVTSIDYYQVLERINVSDNDIAVLYAENTDDETYNVSFKVETPENYTKEEEFNSIAYVDNITSKDGNEYKPTSSSSYFGGYVLPDTGESGKTMTTDLVFNIPNGEKIDFINIITSNGDVIKVKVN